MVILALDVPTLDEKKMGSGTPPRNRSYTHAPAHHLDIVERK